MIDRREFLRAGAAAAAGTALPPALSLRGTSSRRPGASDMLRVAVAGVRGRGSAHLSEYLKMEDVEVAAICDIDSNVIGPALKSVEKKSGKKPRYFQDFRKLVEDPSIDAVSIATTNHTHTLLSIWAVQAGKHVYVEKPLSHNVWEGRKLVEAARKYNKIVQHGTQSRSSGAWKGTIEALKAGKLGKVKIARGLCYKHRGSIGKKPDGEPPPGVDYDLWLGPAPVRPFNPNRFHYNWHWHWDYGNGDIGNQGVHQMDIARWGLGQMELPTKVTSLGGRFGYEDDGETPNTEIVLFEYPDAQLIFEVRGLNTDKFMGSAIGNIFHCDEGYTVETTGFDKGGRKTGSFTGKGGDHFRNFIDTVKSGKREGQNADVLEGHLSAALCHLGNISYRLGELVPFGKTGPFGANSEANATFERMVKHLRDNEVDTDKVRYRMGRTLTFDPKNETFPNDPDAAKLLTREYRKPFVVPDKV